jgi:H+/Cl- antiporter ClcA
MSDTSDLAKAVQEVTEKAQLIIRDEIELAKAEMTVKATRLAKGAAIGAAAGIFVLAALIYGLHFLSWGFYSWFFDSTSSPWLGYLCTTVLLLIFAVIAGLVAKKLVSGSTPPTPKMAIEEAQLVRKTVDEARSGDRRLEP